MRHHHEASPFVDRSIDRAWIRADLEGQDPRIDSVTRRRCPDLTPCFTREEHERADTPPVDRALTSSMATICCNYSLCAFRRLPDIVYKVINLKFCPLLFKKLTYFVVCASKSAANTRFE